MSITLSEAESRRVVARHGVPVSPFVTADTTETALAAVADSADLAYPVVAKLCGRTIAHKTERGLVRLRLEDRYQLRLACDDLLAAAQPDDGAVELLVTPMVPGNRELIAGLTTDAQFGLVAMLGVGGILAEAVRDVTFRLVPFSPPDAEEMIDDLAGQALLGEFRGEPAVDRDALVAALTALVAVGTKTPGLISADVNPLVIVEGRPVAVDALVELDGGPDAVVAVAVVVADDPGGAG